jgi:hypothetical protein
MTTTLSVDDESGQRVRDAAHAAGVSVTEYMRTLTSGGKSKASAAPEMSPEVISRLEALEARASDLAGRLDVLEQAHEDAIRRIDGVMSRHSSSIDKIADKVEVIVAWVKITDKEINELREMQDGYPTVVERGD